MVNVYHQTLFIQLIGNNQHGDKLFSICETEFKTRLGNLNNSFKNRQKEKDTERSK